MAINAGRMTVEEFDQWVELPENADRLFEYVGGEVVEVPSNAYSSRLSARIIRYLDAYADEHNLGLVTGEAGGYMVAGERYAPAAAFISKQKQTELADTGYNPLPPDLAVEVQSPSDDPYVLRMKIVNYLAAGTTVWVVDRDNQRVEVYVPGQKPYIVEHDGVLDGGATLPGFTLAVADIFRGVRS